MLCVCGRTKRIDSAVCRHCNAHGEANGNWGGGRIIHQGYVMLLRPEHPRASCNGYVFEHILVMEERLGRLLLPGENVHHKNGVKADNRDKNLELWVRPQPTGIRVEDAVEWAREILRRYA